jgi:hypothetical protein
MDMAVSGIEVCSLGHLQNAKIVMPFLVFLEPVLDRQSRIWPECVPRGTSLARLRCLAVSPTLGADLASAAAAWYRAPQKALNGNGEN